VPEAPVSDPKTNFRASNSLRSTAAHSYRWSSPIRMWCCPLFRKTLSSTASLRRLAQASIAAAGLGVGAHVGQLLTNPLPSTQPCRVLEQG
jgi:hypothetical protein